MVMVSCLLAHDLGFFFFFFQAEDGIRDVAVTGVQTCALPISPRSGNRDRRLFQQRLVLRRGHVRRSLHGDRKSTRLNSSHGYISYAVFCLKKKKNSIVDILFDDWATRPRWMVHAIPSLGTRSI